MSLRSVANVCSALTIFVLLGGCESGGGAETGGPNARGDIKERESAQPDFAEIGVRGPALPDEGGRFAPSLARLVDEEPRLETLGEVEQCGQCHAEIVAQWRDSMHAFASFDNPLYRMAFDDFVGHGETDDGKTGESGENGEKLAFVPAATTRRCSSTIRSSTPSSPTISARIWV